MMLWAEAVRRAGSVEPDKVIAALPGTRYDGPGGLYSIDEQANHTVMDIHIAIGNKDRGFDVVKSFPSVSPAIRRRYATCAATPTTPVSTSPSFRSGCARAAHAGRADATRLTLRRTPWHRSTPTSTSSSSRSR